MQEFPGVILVETDITCEEEWQDAEVWHEGFSDRDIITKLTEVSRSSSGSSPDDEVRHAKKLAQAALRAFHSLTAHIAKEESDRRAAAAARGARLDDLIEELGADEKDRDLPKNLTAAFFSSGADD